MKALLVFLSVLPAVAGEYAILSNGFRVYADRHEKHGDSIRLHLETGVTELPASMIVGFELEEYVPQAPAVSPAGTAETAAPERVKSVKELVDEAAVLADLPPAIVHSIARAESGYRQDAVSPKGAIGVMQLMPATAAELRANPHDAAENTKAGAMYLRQLLVKYDGDVTKALAAYNAGPGAVDKYNGVPPYRETRSYIQRVISNYKKLGGE